MFLRYGISSFQKDRGQHHAAALCSVVSGMGITKGRGQNIVCGHPLFSARSKKSATAEGGDFSALASRLYSLEVRKAPHRVWRYPFMRRQNQCGIFQSTSCAPRFVIANTIPCAVCQYPSGGLPLTDLRADGMIGPSDFLHWKCRVRQRKRAYTR